MDNRPAIDRELIIPMLIGGLSIIGIAVVLLIGRALNAPAQVAMTPSATPFRYLYLGTEPAISTPLTEGSEIAPPIDGTSIIAPPSNGSPVNITPFDITSIVTAPTSFSASTPLILPSLNATTTSAVIILRTNTPSPTLSTPVVANNYDDTDARLSYSTGWLSQTGVSGAYQNTLHISDTVGNSVTFTFTGNEIQLFYQAGASLGTVTITFDTETLAIPVSQAQSTGVWVYMLETTGVHTVTIRHTSGGSVNIDKLVIPAPTVTPTRTPTPTP